MKVKRIICVIAASFLMVNCMAISAGAVIPIIQLVSHWDWQRGLKMVKHFPLIHLLVLRLR